MESKKKRVIEPEQVKMVVAMFVVAAVAALLLGLTDIVTRAPIAEAEKEALHKALGQVLPPHANDPLEDMLTIKPDGSDTPKQFYPARDKAGNSVGMAWETIAPDGYSGTIRILMGVFPDGTVHAIRITSHRETPGLGDGIVHNSKWLGSFAGRTLDNVRWAVKKDGGEFDQFTGATITPRAVIKAVKQGLVLFRDNRDALLAPKEKVANDKAPAKDATGSSEKEATDE
ncbi:MAG: RnfABCDGE type electron transport complex subunit G [Mariprofundaceae bacterium]|nr:RnfABCDGE type electron transport complex subunit G [Mariprofundaceae bacterium]